jgi:ubiquitin-protein ligase
MHASPRLRRLRNDFTALERLREDSSVFSFTAQGNPPHHYQLMFKGRGLWRDRGQVRPAEIHRVDVKLGASYPRTMPEIHWITPIYHPNISEIGMVCLGGYGTNWVPSVQLDELCTMLWDMARYHNYDIRSPYNRDAALWAANQTAIAFPTDRRPLRDLRAAKGRLAPDDGARRVEASDKERTGRDPSRRRGTTKVRRFAQIYGMIFGTVNDSGVYIDSVSARTRPAPEADSGPFPDPSTSGTEPNTEFAFQEVEVQEVPCRDRNQSDNDDEEILFIG